MKERVSVLFVCLGNICRSPTSEGVFRSVAENQNLDFELFVDSAGTAGYHIGHPPDSRAIRAANRRGVDLTNLRARRITHQDYEQFDYIIGMDRWNYDDLKEMAPSDYKGRVCLFMEFASGWDNDEIPDPYYGGPNGFEQVLDMVENASAGLLEDIKKARSNS